jgi:hypothetical protein
MSHCNSQRLKEHDFLQPQPVKDAAVFLLRHILHDWQTSTARTILQRLAEAAAPSTRLVIIDQVLPHATTASAVHSFDDISGAASPSLPAPLLASAGAETAFELDVIVGAPHLRFRPPAHR